MHKNMLMNCVRNGIIARDKAQYRNLLLHSRNFKLILIDLILDKLEL